jgi:hypothetical protein
MTGIAHFFHLLASHRLQFHFLAFIWDAVRNHKIAMATPPPPWGSMSLAAVKAGLSNLIAWAYSCTLPCCGSANPRRTLHAIAAVLVSASCPCASMGAQIVFQVERLRIAALTQR